MQQMRAHAAHSSQIHSARALVTMTMTMTGIVRRVGCILAYDEACSGSSEAALDDCPDDGVDDGIKTCGAISVAWFDVVVNYALVATNAAIASSWPGRSDSSPSSAVPFRLATRLSFLFGETPMKGLCLEHKMYRLLQ